MTRPLLILLLAAASCAAPREATVSLPPEDALRWAVQTLESFEYNVVDVDPLEGEVRGVRTADPAAPGVGAARSAAPGASTDVLWTVTVHVFALDTGTRYRVRGRATHETTERRSNPIPSSHLDRILARLAEGWR